MPDKQLPPARATPRYFALSRRRFRYSLPPCPRAFFPSTVRDFISVPRHARARARAINRGSASDEAAAAGRRVSDFINARVDARPRAR